MAPDGPIMTLEEFLTLPEEKPALEYADGVIEQKVAPQTFHGRMQYKFAEWVNLYAEPRQLAMAFTETRSTFGGRSYVPDVGIYSWARLPRQSSGKLLAAFRTPWSVAVEVVSPEQSRRNLEDKCRWYVTHGVALALLIDPDREDVVRFGDDGTRIVLRDRDRIDLDTVIPGFALTVADLVATLYPG